MEIKETDLTLKDGHVTLENVDMIKEMLGTCQPTTMQIKVSVDGKVWVDVNGISLVRFYPVVGGSNGYSERCEDRNYIHADPHGSSSSGWGCGKTGGHCMKHLCPLEEKVAK